MVMLVRRGRPSHPPVKNCRNHDVFNDLGGGAGAPATSQVPKKIMESNVFSMVLEVGRGARQLPPPEKL